jgi:hypothetical protein
MIGAGAQACEFTASSTCSLPPKQACNSGPVDTLTQASTNRLTKLPVGAISLRERQLVARSFDVQQEQQVPRGDGESAGPRTRPPRSPSGAGDPGPRRWNGPGSGGRNSTVRTGTDSSCAPSVLPSARTSTESQCRC